MATWELSGSEVERDLIRMDSDECFLVLATVE